MGIPDTAGLELHSKWPQGPKNLITDVPGVKVGHVTLKGQDINTGVTVILPHSGNLFRDKVMAAACVINGFGKSIGILQIQELGTIETPIVLTNTMSIGTAFTGLCRYMLEQNPEIGVSTGTVNCLITECNDGRLNDIRGFHIQESHVLQAIACADEWFEEGSVGGGTGMCCLGLKGGIGSASRQITADGQTYTLGAAVMSNFGAAGNLVIGGIHYDTVPNPSPRDFNKDRGSIIVVIATDLPLSERQLERVAKRATVALGRTGSYCGNGSGDIAIAFTTANRVPHYSQRSILSYRMFCDEELDRVFEACVEAVEESIISSLYHAQTTAGIRGETVLGLKDFLAGAV